MQNKEVQSAFSVFWGPSLSVLIPFTILFVFLASINIIDKIEQDIDRKVQTALEQMNIKTVKAITSGREVTLTGFVRSQIQKNIALKTTSSLKGVNSIIDKLEKKDFNNWMIENQRIQFYFNKTDLTPKGIDALLLISEILKEYQDIGVEIQGHTDNIGTKEYNLVLGKKRAKVVYDRLVNFGIAAKRLILKSEGLRVPLEDNSIKDNQRLNRRVQLKVINIIGTQG